MMNLDNLTTHEIEMLEILNGKKTDIKWGAWMTAACEALKSRGYAEGTYHITKKGKDFLHQMECNYE